MNKLRAQTRLLQTWIAVWLLLQGLCQVSGDPVATETAAAEEGPKGPAAGGMSEEQKAFLKWYYRTEDPSSWKYAMLGLSFVALLLGSVLLVIGTMANRSRRKLAQYKAAARAVQSDELQGLAAEAQACSGPPQAKTPPQEDPSTDTLTSPASQTPHAGQPNGKTLKGILTAPDCDSHEGEHVQISAPQHESEPVQICQPPQESEPIEISVTPQDTEPLQTDVPPQDTEPPQTDVPPQDTESPQTDVPPQDTEPPQTDVPPQDTEPAQIGVQSEESEAVQMSVAPQGNESPQIITAPLASEHAEVSQTSQASEPAQPPQEYEPLQNSEIQESRSDVQSPPDGAVTQESTSTDAIS